MSFGERLKEARTLRGLTQKQLAEKLNIGSTTVTGYEKDNSEPNMLTISKIMEILEVDANFLFQDEKKELYENEASPEEFENIVKKYRDLDTHGKKMVDFTLNEEWERSTELAKENAEKGKEKLVSISKYTKEGENGNNTEEFSEELSLEKDYLKPQAAHNDNESKEQISLMQDDMTILKRSE